ncbi:uncharacterized protein LOC134833780 [Culicoides brevitarsis]|uniref:uncharacterized protein LOC134833780 n=1 Tax=Culicoides brevitarsis TaxID=469753 RepID=UPI00307C9A60
MKSANRNSILCGLLFLPVFIGFCVGAPAKQYDLTTFLAPDSNDSTQEDTDVAALDHLKHSTTHQTKDETLPALEKQLESQTELNLPHNVDVHDVENPVNEKPTTVTSHIKSEVTHEHERPNVPPFDESSLPQEQQHEDEQKPTQKSYSGAARLMTCSTCGGGEKQQQPASPHAHSTDKRIKLNVNRNTIQNAESLFKHKNGQYSATDLAQYIFWTGDEAGVARAIEELIDSGLLSRDSALILLKEIRLVTDELQETYSKYANEVTSARYQKDDELIPSNLNNKPEIPSSTLSPAVLKTLASIPNLLKLEGAAKNDVYFDESSGRLRLADFLYAEYTLEQVIYQLARVMFTQSLTQDQSEDTQVALEKLTAFLENEGQQGRISPVLQKKILDVLLAALSDVLHDSPELMSAAKHALGSYLSQLPVTHEYKN